MNKIYRTLLFFSILNFFFSQSAFCKELIIFHAGSLAKPLKEICDEFNKIYPDIEIMREASGSREAAFKVASLNRNCDLLFVADYKVIKEILMPEYTNFYLIFARNEMVVAFSDWSKYASEINKDNWYKILTRKGVRIGRSDENLDPCGYRTLMVWQLAEDFYKEKGLMERLNRNCPKENIRPKAIELVAQIESLDLDYVFEYLSAAVQHRLQYIKLPKQINLGYFEYKDVYKKAKVKIKGPKGFSIIEGSPIQYAVTIPKNSPHRKEAIKFLKFLLTQKAQKILKRNSQPIFFLLKGNVPQDLKFLEQFRR